MLKIEDLSVRYEEQTVIDNLSYEFEIGKKYAIIGASGIGKTTLLNTLVGLIKPTAGVITSEYKRPTYIFQEPRLFPSLNALENVRLVCNDTEKATALLDKLISDTDAKKKYPNELSGGMKQRVAIARALAYDADIVFMDEPFKCLDIETRADVRRLVFDMLREKTVILVTHDVEDLPYCDTVLRMEDAPVTHLKTEESGNPKTE